MNQPIIPSRHIINFERGDTTMLENLCIFAKNAPRNPVEVVLEFREATCSGVTASEKANIGVDIAESLSWELGRTFLKNSFTSPLREIILTSQRVIGRIKFVVKLKSETMDFEVRLSSTGKNMTTGWTGEEESIGCFLFTVGREEKIVLAKAPEVTVNASTEVLLPADTAIAYYCTGVTRVDRFADGAGGYYETTTNNSADCGWHKFMPDESTKTVDKNIITIDIKGAPNTGRTFVASLIRKALRGAGIRNVDVSQCGNDIEQLDKQGIPGFVIDGINERGLTYVISDNVEKPARNPLKFGDQKWSPVLSKIPTHGDKQPTDKPTGRLNHVVGPQGCSFTTGRAAFGLPGVFIEGDGRNNDEIIQEFINLKSSTRGFLLGDSFMSCGGVVNVKLVVRDTKELEEIKAKYNIDLALLGKGGCDTWYILTPVK